MKFTIFAITLWVGVGVVTIFGIFIASNYIESYDYKPVFPEERVGKYDGFFVINSDPHTVFVAQIPNVISEH